MKMKRLVVMLVMLSASYAQVTVGEQAPGIYLTNLQGESFYLSRVAGTKVKLEARKPVMLSFFQTTCEPCMVEINELQKLQEEFPGIGIYLVNIKESNELVAGYVAKFEAKFEVLMDQYGVISQKRYGVVDEQGIALLPNTYIIAPDGTLYYHHTDFKPGDEELYRQKLTELVRQQEELVRQQEELAAKGAEVAKKEEGAVEDLEVGQPAPTFSLPRLKGKQFYLSRVVGSKAKPENRRPVVVSFFQTTCIPCKAEITEFEKLQEEFPDIQIYLVALYEEAELVAAYMEEFDIKLEMLLDRYANIGKKYGVVQGRTARIPHSFIIAPDGTLYYAHRSFAPGDEEIYRQKFVELTSQE